MNSSSDKEDYRTPRQILLSILEDSQIPLSIRELSIKAGLSEKEVIHHLSHLRKSVRNKMFRLEIIPAECKDCGFSFQKRKDFKKPSRCPICKSEYIDPPLIDLQRK